MTRIWHSALYDGDASSRSGCRLSERASALRYQVVLAQRPRRAGNRCRLLPPRGAGRPNWLLAVTARFRDMSTVSPVQFGVRKDRTYCWVRMPASREKCRPIPTRSASALQSLEVHLGLREIQQLSGQRICLNQYLNAAFRILSVLNCLHRPFRCMGPAPGPGNSGQRGSAKNF